MGRQVKIKHGTPKNKMQRVTWRDESSCNQYNKGAGPEQGKTGQMIQQWMAEWMKGTGIYDIRDDEKEYRRGSTNREMDKSRRQAQTRCR